METRFNGTLKKWNAERGFGFVVAEPGDQELFVHVTAFPRDGRTPAVGERLTFEMEQDKEGRKRAVRVRRPGAAGSLLSRHAGEQARHQNRREHHRNEGSSFGARFVVLLLAAGVWWYGYTQYAERTIGQQTTPQSVMSPAPANTPEVRSPAFQCDGRRYCSQMSSCSEAKLFLQHCPGMEMDGDGDRIPCEEQWCSGSFGG